MIQLPSTVVHACAYLGQVQLTVVWAVQSQDPSGFWVILLSTGHIRLFLGPECGNSSVVEVSNQISRVHGIHFTLHTLQNESTGTPSSQTTFAVQRPSSTSVLFSSHSQTFSKVHRAEGCYQQGKVIYW